MLRSYVFVLAMLLSAGASASYEERVFEGKAKDPDSNRLLYVEQHNIELAASGEYRSGRVEYIDDQGELIALKRLDYGENAFAPELTFDDFRAQSRVSVQREEGAIRISYLSMSGDAQGYVLEDEALIDARSEYPVVIDAGFDVLVEAHWQKLMAGDALNFDFLALSRAQLIGFSLQQTNRSGNTVELTIAPRNWFIALLMEPIVLRYDADSKKLMQYRGITNVRAEEAGALLERHFDAQIDYSYLSY